MSRLDDAGKLIIEARTIEALVEKTAFPRIDAAKIDIEGHEFAALSIFFENAPAHLWPRFAILETSHERIEARASGLFEERDYRLICKSRLNSVFVRQ